MDAKLKKLAEAAEIIHPGVGRWAYERWGEWNELCFEGKLKPCGITWGLTPHGRTTGLYQPAVNVILLHQRMIGPQGQAWRIALPEGNLYAADVLLHEMVHQYIHTVLGIEDSGRSESPGGNSSHNNPYWVGEVNRLSPLLGLDCRAVVIRQKRVNGGGPTWYKPEGYMARVELSTWPYSVRPEGYYQGQIPPAVHQTRAPSKPKQAEEPSQPVQTKKAETPSEAMKRLAWEWYDVMESVPPEGDYGEYLRFIAVQTLESMLEDAKGSEQE